MSDCNIKIPAVLYERLKILAGKQGYSSAEEMINHILERTVDSASHDQDVETVKQQLKGLGYFNG